MQARFGTNPDNNCVSSRDGEDDSLWKLSNVVDGKTSIMLKMKEQNTWYMVEVLNERLNALSNHVEENRRMSLADIGVYKPNFDTKRLMWKRDYMEDLQDYSEGEVCCQRVPHSLAHRNPNLPQSDAGRNLDVLFQKYRDDNDEEAGIRGISKGKKRVNWLEIKRKEKRKKTIQSLQRQLENNSSRYLARAANSVVYRSNKPRKEGIEIPYRSDENFLDKVNAYKEDWPIPLGGNEMNPELLLRLSCEQMIAWNDQQKMLKCLVLHEIFLNIYIYMYWFAHCRFFQVCLSCEDQLYSHSFSDHFVYYASFPLLNTFEGLIRDRAELFTRKNRYAVPTLDFFNVKTGHSGKKRRYVPPSSLCSFQSDIPRFSVPMPWEPKPL